MIYYTNDKEKFEYTPTSLLIGKGTQARIYKLNDRQCIKIYNKNAYRISPEIFALFKSNSFNGYYQLGDLLYLENTDEIGAYTMTYYPKGKYNILDMPTEYTLFSFSLLYNTIKDVSKMGIQFRDLIPSNVIISDDGIVVIDIDRYRLSKTLNTDYIFSLNVESLFLLFNRLYIEGMEEKGYDPFAIIKNYDLSEYLDWLFRFNYSNPVEVLSKKMSRVKRPIDLFAKMLPNVK